MQVLDAAKTSFDFRMYCAIAAIKAANIEYQTPLKGNGYKLDAKRRAREIARVVGERVMVARLEMGYTQTDLAIKAEVSCSYISNLETGKGGNFYNIVQVADALGIPMAVFLEGTVKNGTSAFKTTE